MKYFIQSYLKGNIKDHNANILVTNKLLNQSRKKRITTDIQTVDTQADKREGDITVNIYINENKVKNASSLLATKLSNSGPVWSLIKSI